MQIGLIGGIGPAATDAYYRSLIAAFAERGAPLELTMAHADTKTLLGNLTEDNAAAQVAIYERLTRRLEAAGAERVVVTSIAGHFCIEAFKPVSALPVIDLIETINDALQQRGARRIGVLGTRTVMETRLYGRITAADLIPPLGEDLDRVHDAYVALAAAGAASDAHRTVFDAACRRLRDEAQVDAILLGGTDLALIYDEAEDRFPIIDAVRLHVDAIVETALG